MATATVGSRRFRLFRPLRLRTLLIVFSFICLACGWEANRVHRREQAVALLKHWDFIVSACYSSNGSHLPWTLLPDWAEHSFYPWRLEYLCVDSNFDVFWASQLPIPSAHRAERTGTRSTHIRIKPTTAERKQILEAMATLRELGGIYYTALELDDEDLRILSSLHELEILAFKTHQLTSAAVAQIQKFPNLYRLVLISDNPEFLSADAIIALQKLTCLEDLFIAAPLHAEAAARITAAFPNVNVEVSAQ